MTPFRTHRSIRPALAALCALLAFGSAGGAAARDYRGATFADKVRVEDTGGVLTLQGATALDRNFLPFQLVVLYADQRHTGVAELTAARAPLRIVLHWLVAPEFSAADAGKYWNARFDQLKMEPGQKEALAGHFARLATALGGGARDSETIVDYDPEVGLRVRRPGAEVVRFAGVDFSRAVISLWLGVDNEQRRELLGTGKPPADGEPH